MQISKFYIIFYFFLIIIITFLYQTVILQKKEEYMSTYEHILYIIIYVYVCLYIFIYSYIKNFFRIVTSLKVFELFHFFYTWFMRTRFNVLIYLTFFFIVKWSKDIFAIYSLQLCRVLLKR